MKPLIASSFALLLAMVTTIPLAAQWPSYPTPGVPKGPDGKPDVKGPAPRAADGHPDFTGVWVYTRRAGLPTPPPGGPLGQATTGSQFWDISTGMADPIPFQPWAREMLERRMAEHSKDNPDAHCLPMGFMQFHTHPQPRKIIQTPDVILIIYEANSGLRQIFMDGRPLPGPDAEPWWYGYSVGKWEGDTLVVESRGFRDGEWLDVRGSPLTPSAKVTEKFRRPTYGSLEIEITVDDPKAYTKPWTVRIAQRAMLNTELIEFICEERDATHYVGAEVKK